jgi:4-hydroxybenzoate polyprenyltransferase
MNKLLGKLNPYINLIRINKPTGIWLLFLPCLFGIALSAKYNSSLRLINTTILFLLGSITMRSAGCIINDILDRNFDKNVKRTKIRPIASGKISIGHALILLIILLSISLAILLQFNYFSGMRGAFVSNFISFS